MYGAGAAWSHLFLPGAGADPSRSEPESAPGPWRPGAGAGAAQKSGGSATLYTGTAKSVSYCLLTLLSVGSRSLCPVPDPHSYIIAKFDILFSVAFLYFF